MPRVYNKRGVYPKDAIYVGRPSKWGNPFRIGKETREVIVKRFRESLSEQQKEDIRTELKGKDLVCWCAPEACHADVLLEIANEV